MFPIKLLGIAVAGGAALGIWASSAIKEKLGGGTPFKKVKKNQTEVIYLDDDMDPTQGIKIVGHRKPKPKAIDNASE